jgi:hypothetical protein
MLSYEERRRLDAYLASQDYFEGVAEDFAEEMIIHWLRRNLPWILDRIRQAACRAWDAIRAWLGF